MMTKDELDKHIDERAHDIQSRAIDLVTRLEHFENYLDDVVILHAKRNEIFAKCRSKRPFDVIAKINLMWDALHRIERTIDIEHENE